MLIIEDSQRLAGLLRDLHIAQEALSREQRSLLIAISTQSPEEAGIRAQVRALSVLVAEMIFRIQEDLTGG